MSDRYPVRARDVAFRPFDEELLLVSAHQGRIYSLNGVAGFVWDSLDGRRSVEDVVEMVCERYDVEREIAAADIEELLGALVERGVATIEATATEGV